MTLRSRILDLLARGKDPRDPDEFVESMVVPVSGGPMPVARLGDAGIDAHGDETFNVATSSVSDCRVMVRRRDLARAAATTER